MSKNITYKKRVRLLDFQACSVRIDSLIEQGNLDDAFTALDELNIGPNTLNPKCRNYVWWIIESLRSKSTSNDHKTKSNYLRFLELFLSRGVEINHQDRYNITALSWAVYHFQPEACRMLLVNGAIPDIPDYSGRTPLDYAIFGFYSTSYRNSENIMSTIMKDLLLHGANPNRTYPSAHDVKVPWWLFINGDSGNTYLSPMHLLQTQAVRRGYESHIEDEPRLKIVLTTIPQ